MRFSMDEHFFNKSIYVAMFLATNFMIEARAQYITPMINPSLGSNICEIERSVSARSSFDLKNQATGLPQSYSDCLADYTFNMALIKVEMVQEYNFISCLQKEINKNRDDHVSVENLSKSMAAAALHLKELRQNTPTREQKALAERKTCERAVDALSKYRSPAPPPKAGSAGADGVYVGSTNGENRRSLKCSWVVSGRRIAFSCDADPGKKQYAGNVAPNGEFVIHLTSSDSTFSSERTYKGKIIDNRLSGTYDARYFINGKPNGQGSGTFSASRTK